MRKTLIITVALIALLLLISTGYWFLIANNQDQNIQQGGTIFPGGNTPGTAGSLTVETSDGSPILVKDFISNGITIEDPSNKGWYFLAGDSGACNPDGTCPSAGSEKDFSILYDSVTKSFVVSINTEPLGAVRKNAEQYLMNALGLTESDMCRLEYSVMTTSYVNATYGGENLGFSFCPGAIKLP